MADSDLAKLVTLGPGALGWTGDTAATATGATGATGGTVVATADFGAWSPLPEQTFHDALTWAIPMMKPTLPAYPKVGPSGSGFMSFFATEILLAGAAILLITAWRMARRQVARYVRPLSRAPPA